MSLPRGPELAPRISSCSHGPDEGDEGVEGRQGHDEGGDGPGPGRRDGAEEEGRVEGPGQPGGPRGQGGEEGREVQRPGRVHGEDPREAGDEGGQARDLRQDGHGQGEAGQDHREGLRGGRAEEVGLRAAPRLQGKERAFLRSLPFAESLGFGGAAKTQGLRKREAPQEGSLLPLEPRRRPQTDLFSAAAAKAFTMVLAGFALTMTILPKISRLPAFVAGFTRVFTMHTPGTLHFPTFFTSLPTRPARLSRTFDTSFLFSSVSSARVWAITPFVMALPPFAFIAFIGAMAGSGERSCEVKARGGFCVEPV